MDPKDAILNFPQMMELSFKAGHSLIIGNKPEKVDLADLAKRCIERVDRDSVHNFGLFDSSSPNYTTYYPDTTEEDWNPSDAEFVQPIFRLFSETMVIKHGVPIDFTQNNVVKKSMKLLIGQSIYPDHESDVVGNALGAIPEVKWQQSYEVEGVNVPAGINGVLKIDAKSNPRIARGILMSPPSIHSASVTVKFKWDKSHPDMEDFWSKVGTFDKEGELIRLVVTEILAYHEISLVSHGADPFAQKVDENGIINNPKYASAVYGLSADKDNKTQFDFKNMGITTHTLSFSNKSLKTPNMTFTELLLALGLKADSYKDQEELTAALIVGLNSQTQLQALLEIDKDVTPDSLTALLARPETSEDGPSEEQVAALAKVTDLGGLDKIDLAIADGVTYLDTIRNGALVNYKLVMGDKSSEVIENTIKEADLEKAKAFEAQYSAMVEEKLPMTCKKCNSTEVDRASSNPEEGTSKKVLTHREKRDKYAAKHHKKASDFHKED